jgi:phage N-6-adenine-methyltransferase
MTSPVLFSSKSDDWPTSQAFFDKMNRRYGPFDLDVCAAADNAKCSRFFTAEVDGLRQPWQGRCWMNPPYGKTIGRWICKAWESSLAGATVVCLLPARVDTRWWHGYIEPYATVVDFVKGRLRFGDGKYPAPFPSAVVVFEPAKLYPCLWCERPFVPKRTDSKFCSAACKQGAYRARIVTAISVTQPLSEASQ